jgi:hypothetical protein
VPKIQILTIKENSPMKGFTLRISMALAAIMLYAASPLFAAMGSDISSTTPVISNAGGAASSSTGGGMPGPEEGDQGTQNENQQQNQQEEEKKN